MLRRALAVAATLGATIVLLVGFNVVMLLSPRQVDARVRAVLGQLLRAPHHVEAIELGWHGLSIRGLVVRRLDGNGSVLEVDEASVEVDWARLEIGPVRVRGAVVHVRRDAAGKLDLLEVLDPSLRQSGAGPKSLPDLRIDVIGARLRYEDARALEPGQRIELADVDLSLSLRGDRARLSVVAREPWLRTLTASLEADLTRRTVDLELEAEKVNVQDTTRELLPPAGRRLFATLRPKGVADASLKVRLAPDEPLFLAGEVRVHNGGMHLVMFPYEVGGVTGRIEVSRNLVRLDGLTTRSESLDVTCDAEIYLGGPGEDERIDLRLDVARLEVDRRFADALPQQAQPIWRRFAPEGRARGRMRIAGLLKPRGQPDELALDIEAQALGMRARFADIPLPVTALEGGVRVNLDIGEDRPDRVRRNRTELVVLEDVRGRVAGGEVTVRGHAGEDQVYMRVEARGVRADDQLLAEIGPLASPARRVRPQGLVDVNVDVFDRPERGPDGRMDVAFSAVVVPRPGLAVNLRELPYPLSIEAGAVRFTDLGLVELDRLVARGPAANRVEVQGRIVAPTRPRAALADAGGEGAPAPPSAPLSMELSVVAEGVRVDATLRRALAEARFDDLDLAEAATSAGAPGAAPAAATGTGTPTGTTTAASADPGASADLPLLARLFPELGLAETGLIERLVVSVSRGARSDLRGTARFRGLRVRPRVMPFALREVAGQVAFTDRDLTIEEVVGVTGLEAGGRRFLPRLGHLRANGRIALTREGFSVPAGPDERRPGPAAATVRVVLRDVPIDRRLGRALPASLGAGLEAAGPRPSPRAPRGPLRGLASGAGHLLYVPADGLGTIVWNAELVGYGRGLDFGLVFDDLTAHARVHGALPLAKASAPLRFAEGHVRVTSATWKRQPIEVAALLEVGTRELVLRDLRGRFLGGTLFGDQVFYRFDGTRFGGRFTLQGGRVERWVGMQQGFRGQVDGWIAFDGVPNAPANRAAARLRGSGRLEVSEARLWSIPDPAEGASIGVRIEGDRLQLGEPLAIRGKALTFRGRGEIGLDGRVDIRIAPEVKALGDGVPVLEVFGKALSWISRQVFGVLTPFRIVGPIEDPTVYPLPLIGLDVRDLIPPGGGSEAPSDLGPGR